MSEAMVEKRPPERLTMRFCPVCGRDDRYGAFTGSSHFTRGSRCSGTPVTAIYTLYSIRREALS